MDSDEFANMVVEQVADIFAGKCQISLDDVTALEADPTQAHILGGLYYLNEELQARERARSQAISELETTISEMRVQREQLLRTQALNFELTAPIIRIGQGILMTPLVGSLDTTRGDQILERILNSIKEHRARTIVLDVTGMPTIDAAVARYVLRAAAAARFLGARAILAGISPPVAAKLASLAADAELPLCVRDVETALKHCLPQR